MRGRFRLLPHTADLLLEVRGEDLADLFPLCVTALYSLLTDRRRVREKELRTLTVSGELPEDQLFLLLKEALALFSEDRFLVRRARGKMDSSGMKIEVKGEIFDVSRHALYREIKAVTAHALEVVKTPQGVVARFLLDV